MLTIRTEQPSDYEKVHQIIIEAFKNAEHSDGTEQELVKKLRQSPSFIPELSLVAIKDNEIDNEPCLLNGTVKSVSYTHLRAHET